MDPFYCANRMQNDTASTCFKRGTTPCESCYLVLYCSKECQNAHHANHQQDCQNPLNNKAWRPAWEIEGRIPPFAHSGNFRNQSYGGSKYLWGNMPAFDLLRLEDNEGVDPDLDLSILMAASGDLRNFFQTIVSLPNTFTRKLTIDINDIDEVVVRRNFVLLLIAFNFGPKIASVMMLHVWYSAFLPKSIMEAIKDEISPILKKVLVPRVEGILEGKWSLNRATLRARLDRQVWLRMLGECLGKHVVPSEDADELRASVLFEKSREDYRDRHSFLIPPPWRLAKLRFRKHGILVPFGASCEEFNVPNPTIFKYKSPWPMRDSADPIDGWTLSDVLGESGGAKNDVYGLLHLHVRRLLEKFCEKLFILKLDICLYQNDARDLPNQLKGELRFYDRIEFANICDSNYLGPAKSIKLFGPLLRPKADNPKATLIMLFLNATIKVTTEKDMNEMLSSSSIKKVREYLEVDDAVVSGRNFTKAEYVRLADACKRFMDQDSLFERYSDEKSLPELGMDSGLKIKSEHTVISKWPTRVKYGCTQKQFDLALRSSHFGPERYVEWYRA